MSDEIYRLFDQIVKDFNPTINQSAYVSDLLHLLNNYKSSTPIDLSRALVFKDPMLGIQSYTPLQIVCHLGLYDLAEVMLNNLSPEALDINGNNNPEKDTALHLLARNENTALRSVADLRGLVASSSELSSASHSEERIKMERLRALLIEKGADGSLKNANGDIADNIIYANSEGFNFVQSEDNEYFRLKLQEWAPEARKTPHDRDKFDIATNLLNYMTPIGSRTDPNIRGGIYAWRFEKSNQPSKNPNEFEMIFLGTGSMPYFAEHTVMSEGGDVLCQLAYQKTMNDNQTAMVMKGVGTAKLNEAVSNTEFNFSEIDVYYPIHSLIDPKSKYAGGVGGAGFGSGMDRRLKIAMEEFFIPELFKRIHASANIRTGERDQFLINIVGHSRGAITSYYMIDLIEQFVQSIKSNQSISLSALSQMCNLPEEAIQSVLDAIRTDRVEVNLTLLGFDPVEGKFKVGGTYWGGASDTRIGVPIEGIGTFNAQCSQMPERLTRAQIYLAESERRMDFIPTLTSFHPSTEVSIREVNE